MREETMMITKVTKHCLLQARVGQETSVALSDDLAHPEARLKLPVSNYRFVVDASPLNLLDLR